MLSFLLAIAGGLGAIGTAGVAFFPAHTIAYKVCLALMGIGSTVGPISGGIKTLANDSANQRVSFPP